MVIMGGKDGTKAVRDLNVVNIGTAEEPVWALAVDATVTVPEVEVVKAFYTADDLDEDNKIIFTDEMKEFEIWNNNLDEGLEFTIGEITIPIESKNVDSKGLPNKYHFSGCFASFTEVEIAGDDLDFDVIVSG